MLDKVIAALRCCSEPGHLLELEEKLNSVGITAQQSKAGKIFLCRIIDEKPSCTEIFEDHIPICHCNGTLDDRARAIALDFILMNATNPQKIAYKSQQGNYGLYGSAFHDNMIKAISEWIE
jgi:hypothetical protein